MARRPIRRLIKIVAGLRDQETPNRFDDSAVDDATARPPETAPVGDVSGWRVARSLEHLRDQVNLMAPGRSKLSDGTIGDAAHQTRDSDHNPWVIDGRTGVVTALDITHDPDSGCDADAIAESIRAAKDRRVKYVIWNKRIFSSTKEPWTWRDYKGKNAHTKHVHISVLPEKALYDDATDWQLGRAGREGLRARLASGRGEADMAIAWGKKVSAAFKDKVIAISAALGVDPNYLMAAMAFETGRTFDPKIRNEASGATGLIQFLPSTATSLGTSVEALAAMTAVQQLDVVKRYFEPYAGRLNSLEDVYMAILFPRAIGRPVSFVLFASPERAYTQNRGLDANSDGVVTKAEAAEKVHQHLVEGMRPELRG